MANFTNKCNISSIFGKEVGLDGSCHLVVKYSIISGGVVLLFLVVVVMVLLVILCGVAKKMKTKTVKINRGSIIGASEVEDRASTQEGGAQGNAPHETVEDSMPGYDTVALPPPSTANQTEQPGNDFQIATRQSTSTAEAGRTDDESKKIPHYTEVMKNKKTSEAKKNKLVYVSEPIQPPQQQQSSSDHPTENYSALNSTDFEDGHASMYLSSPPPIPPAFNAAYLPEIIVLDELGGTGEGTGAGGSTIDEVHYYNDIAVMRAANLYKQDTHEAA